MADLDALIATLRAGDSPDARAAIRALAELDDDRARSALGDALAGAGALTALAIHALARHGAKAAPVAIAALRDPARRLGGAAVLGRLADPASRELLRPLVGDPDPLVRLTIATALFRCGERDRELWSSWIRRENDLVVFSFLAAIAGGPGVTLTHGTLDHFEEQAKNADTPPEARAGAAWAVAQHDAPRGTTLATQLIADPATATALSSVVRRRGGPLRALIADIPADPAADQTADSVGLPPAAA